MMGEVMQMGDIMQLPPSHGIKRSAVDDLEREQRLTKRFNLLNIDQNRGKFSIPVQSNASPYKSSSVQHLQCAEPISKGYPDPPADCDGMDIEDTPTRVYITDLDAEIASLEPSTPTHPIFLPDIEKHLLGLPASVLGPSAEEEAERQEREKSMQLVIYGLPTSISVPEEQDNVRRAIEEARKRVRDRMPLGGQIEYAVKDPPVIWHGNRHDRNTASTNTQLDDSDAMDIEL